MGETMAGDDRSADARTGGQRGAASDGGAGDGRMIYHLFSSEERRRIVSSFLDNHTIAFSPAAVADAADMPRETAKQTLEALQAVGFLVGHDADEIARLADSEYPAVTGYVGNTDEEMKFYRLDKDSDLAQALGKADAAANRNAAAFLRTAPDIDFE